MVSLHAAFAAMVLSSAGQTVMLDFYADWCGPCKAMEPTVRALQEKGYPVQKVNIDQNPTLAAKYGVRSVPCFVMLVDGQEVDRVVSGTTYSRLERMCKNTSPPQSQNRSPNQLAQNAGSLDGQFAPPGGPTASGAMPGAFPRHEDPNVIPASFMPPANATPIAAQPWSGALPPSGYENPAADGRSSLSGMNMQARGASLDAKLIAASVRLRIEDPDGNSCGSGTIIDARNGDALILTCGHIFRDSQGKGKIEVDLFGPYAGQRVVGQLISFDLKRDVGLVFIRAPGPIAATRLAPPGYRINKGDKVASVGCDNGKDPAVRKSYVTSLNRYAGPANLQVAGQPTEGRSGGGLFAVDGTVIGVCNARDPQDQEGYYAAIDTICAQLDDAHLAFAYQSPQGFENTSGTMSLLAGMTAPPMPQQMSQAAPSSSIPNILSDNLGQPMSSAGASAAGLNSSEQAAMDEIRRRLKEGAEVVCIVRSRRNPQSKSEVIMLDKASPEFLQQLAAETQSQEGRQETSLELPRPKQPTMEWSANPNSNSNSNSKAWRQGQ
jgi:thiol-disulfide isomerase/thioredoxin